MHVWRVEYSVEGKRGTRTAGTAGAMVVYFQDLQRPPMRSEQSIGAQLASDRHDIEILRERPQLMPR